MRQLPLDMGEPLQQRFDNFVGEANGAALNALQTLGEMLARDPAAGVLPAGPAPVYLWGDTGAGKTHLLVALAHSVAERGLHTAWFDARTPVPWELPSGARLVVLDDCQDFDPARQQAAFGLFIEAATQATAMAAAGRLPPVDLALREDLRSRLGWGLVCQVQPISEAERRAVLRREADRRGLFLGDDVMDFLLHRHARDLGSLMRWLDRLDRHALVAQRAITIPLIRDLLTQAETDPA